MARAAPPAERPAFYALASGGWRDLVTLLHPPYTAWHLSYVAIGAAMAPQLHGSRLVLALVAFFLAVGVAAHALDELRGHPLRTQLSDGALIALAGVSLGGAVAVGIYAAATISWTLVPFIAAGVFLVLAYDLEWFGGRFHTDFWFALAWGAFPAATGFWVNALAVHLAGVLAVAACFTLSVAQRRLSSPVRELRRRTVSVSGEQRLRDGRVVALDARSLAAPLEGALAACSLAVTLLAIALVVLRLH
ncbi:MAG: hypothetical protein ABR947_03460 [Solirubrobacteraceae bacterium]